MERGLEVQISEDHNYFLRKTKTNYKILQKTETHILQKLNILVAAKFCRRLKVLKTFIKFKFKSKVLKALKKF
jgi:hypothetical protein